ncbi:MAG TPA: hypothetical protein VGR67_14775 [Candidatus Polarisedimenticolia bacterium]|jgi:hypothetical protein|nr:hypothetical protein [Candidatus Polarisedimenticolia bacterium]
MNGLKALLSVLSLAFPLSIQGQENPEAREGSGEEMILFQGIPSVYRTDRVEFIRSPSSATRRGRGSRSPGILSESPGAEPALTQLLGRVQS